MREIDSDQAADQLCRVLATLRVLEGESMGVEVTELRRCFSETGATGFDLDQAFAAMDHMQWISIDPDGRATITDTGKEFVKKVVQLRNMTGQRPELN